MTGRLVIENLKHKPMRSVLSILLIGVQVTLILTLVGLSRGMIEDSARRQRGVGADILVRPPGTGALTLSGAPLPEKIVDYLQHWPHVVLAAGTVNHPIAGFTLYVAGIDLDTFNHMSGGFKYLEGGPFRGPDDILLDQFYAHQRNVHAGGTINLLSRDWRVAGVVEPGKLSHIILPLRVLQNLTGNTGRISQIFLKVDDQSHIADVLASLKTKFPDYSIHSMEEFTSLISINSVPNLRAFIDVVQGIGVVIGFAVVCLSMYMAVLQRTREIGILRSLGASRWFILEIVLAEGLVMGVAGSILGILLSFGSRWLILALVPASFPQAIVPDWWPISSAITLVGVVLGALYPGLRAARQDPIESLAYE